MKFHALNFVLQAIAAILGRSLAFYRGQKGLSLENSEKNLKRSSRPPPTPGPKKLEKESKMTIFQPFSGFWFGFDSFSTFSELFGSRGRGGAGNPFSDFFRNFLGRGLFDPCKRPTISQCYTALWPSKRAQSKLHKGGGRIFIPVPLGYRAVVGHHMSFSFFQKGRKGAGVKGAGVANCRILRSAVPSIVVWSILLVSLSGVKRKL